MYEGNQTFKYELFLKFIVKLFSELNKSKVKFCRNEIEYSYKKLKNIEGGGLQNYIVVFLGQVLYTIVHHKGKINILII